MSINIGGKKYVPGMYAKKRPTGTQLAENYFRELDKEKLKQLKKKGQPEIYPTICFSRKIGVGALEIADILGESIGYKVIDREILEYIAATANLAKKTVAYYDEKYPGKVGEMINFLFGEKSFIKSDHTRHLFSAVLSLAGLNPTIFVGRGAHLIIPRDRVLAVRFICSDDQRVRRLARILDVKEADVRKKLKEIDKDQAAFFQNTFKKKEVTPYEFDLVINCDYISNPETCAKIVRQAFKEKFGDELKFK